MYVQRSKMRRQRRSEAQRNCQLPTDLMTTHVLALKIRRPRNDPRTDDKECGLQIFLIKVLDEVGSVWRWTIVEATKSQAG